MEKFFFKLHPSYVAYRTQVLISTHDSRRAKQKNIKNSSSDAEQENESEEYEYNNTINNELIPHYTLPIQIQESVFDPEVKEKRMRNSIGFNICREKINTFYSKEKEEMILRDIGAQKTDLNDDSQGAEVVRETFSPQTHSLLTEEEARRLRTGPYLLYSPPLKLSWFWVFFGFFLCLLDIVLHFYFYFLHGLSSGYFFVHGISLFNLIIERSLPFLAILVLDLAAMLSIYTRNALGLTLGVCFIVLSLVNQMYHLPFDLFFFIGTGNSLILLAALMLMRQRVSYSWFNTGIELFNV